MVVRAKDKHHQCKEKDCPCQKDNQKGCQQRYAQKLATEIPAPNQPAPPPPPPEPPQPEKCESPGSACCSECNCELCKQELSAKSRRHVSFHSLTKSSWVGVLKEREATQKPDEKKATAAGAAEAVGLALATTVTILAEKPTPEREEVQKEAQAKDAQAQEAARIFLGARKEVVIRRASSEPRVNDTSGFMYKESTHPSSVTQSEDEAEPPRILEYYANNSPDLSEDSEDEKRRRQEQAKQAKEAAAKAAKASKASKASKPAAVKHPNKLQADMDTTPALSGEDLRLWVDRNLARGREIVAEAVWDNPGLEPEGLQFKAGDTITIQRTEEHNWWWGIRNKGRDDQELGRFPTAAVRVRIGQDHLQAEDEDEAQSARHQNHMRWCVVEEIINSEREFVKTLRDLYEGFMKPAEANGLFSQVQIRGVFSNLEDILNFQTVFLKDLEAIIDWNKLQNACVGEVFMRHVEGFRIYTEYCNGHTQANVMLQELVAHEVYAKFFEECRNRRGMQPIPLDGYLLTPVQRICKYPLQLNELYKYTKLKHPDYKPLRDAVHAMRGMAAHVNECKRRTEGLVKLSVFQAGILDWEGRELIEDSSLLIYQGSVSQVVPVHNVGRRLYMFDNQLIICKRKRTFFETVPNRGLKFFRASLSYRGRVLLQMCEVKDISGEVFFGRTVKYGVRVKCTVRNRYMIFQMANKTLKDKWLEAFRDERWLVQRDRRLGLMVSASDRNRARLAALRADTQDSTMVFPEDTQKVPKETKKERARSRSQGRIHVEDKSKWFKKF